MPDGIVAWLRRRFLAGIFVTVPLVVSIVAIVWVLQWADRLTSGLGERVVGRQLPGLGLLATAAFVLIVGIVATNVIGRRLLQRAEQILLYIPLFKTVYGPLKQLISAFSPEVDSGFKRMVLVDEGRRLVLGFLTKEFLVDRGLGPTLHYAVYVPTNHLYLGDVVVYPADRVSFPSLSVEEGIRAFLTGGMGLGDHVSVSAQPRP